MVVVAVAVGGGRWWQQRSVVRRGEEREVHERLRSYLMKGKVKQQIKIPRNTQQKHRRWDANQH